MKTGVIREDVAALKAKTFSTEDSVGDAIPLLYAPTNTTWPGNGWDHRRTTKAGYSVSRKILRIEFFTNGAIYDYHNVEQSTARAFRRTRSPGQFINTVLNNNPHWYERIE